MAISLLNYRTTPLPWCGLSPAELLMGRKLRTTLPQHLKVLVPKWDYIQHFKRQSQRYKMKQTENYNQAHAVRQRPDLEIGQQVWISDTRNISTRAEVKGLAETPRSYILDTPAGELRRNKCHLTPVPERMCDKQNVEQPMPQQTKSNDSINQPESPQADNTASPTFMRSPIATRSRTGTKIRPPDYY